MIKIGIRIGRDDVWEEAMKNASYTGDKLTDADNGAYRRLMLTDADRDTLGRYWEEAKVMAEEQLKEFIKKGSTGGVDYEPELELPDNYDTELTGAVEAALRDYMVAAVTARWFAVSNKEETGVYMETAQTYMEAALRLLHLRRRPSRPVRR